MLRATAASEAEFSEEEIYVPLRREEAVVQKEAHVREEVRLGKREEREKQTVSETVRKEDVQIEQTDASQSRRDGTRDRTKEHGPTGSSRN